MFQIRCWWRDEVFLSWKSFCDRTVKKYSFMDIIRSVDKIFLYKMKKILRQIINLLKFPNCNTVKWSILQKWSQTVNLIHSYLARRRWYDTNWLDLNENYSWATYHLQNYDVRRFYLLTIWMRLEWTQPILSPFSSTPKKKTTWSVKFHDFQKHNITWDTILRRCWEDDVSRRTVWFARTRILRKAEKHTFYPWAWWSRSRDMWFGRYRWSWRLNIWYQIFADDCKYIIFREIDVKKYSETNFMKIMRYY